MGFENNYFDYRREPWQSSPEDEPLDIEYVLGEVFYKPNVNGETGWLDRTGLIGDFEQAEYLVKCLRDEFRGEFFKEDVKVLRSNDRDKRHFVKYIVMILNPLEKGRFETFLADFLQCDRSRVADLALSS